MQANLTNTHVIVNALMYNNNLCHNFVLRTCNRFFASPVKFDFCEFSLYFLNGWLGQNVGRSNHASLVDPTCALLGCFKVKAWETEAIITTLCLVGFCTRGELVILLYYAQCSIGPQKRKKIVQAYATCQTSFRSPVNILVIIYKSHAGQNPTFTT